MTAADYSCIITVTIDSDSSNLYEIATQLEIFVMRLYTF